MQYAKMKAALSERDSVEGVERAVSQCCLCLVWSIMSFCDWGLQSCFVFSFLFFALV